MNHTAYFQPLQLGELTMKNRIVLAPLTRSRTKQPGNIPTELNGIYYAQRASGGLLISEATQISLQGQGYDQTPGIYTDEQVKGWKKVTEAVHERGGLIFAQLWHVGKASSSQVNGLQPVSSSAIEEEGRNVYILKNGKPEYILTEKPRSLEIHEIQKTIADYRKAAANALKAGFDGVEIHAAHSYLIDQFLYPHSNRRKDEFGGSRTNRMRFLLEVCRVVTSEVGASKTGIRLSPHFHKENKEENIETFFDLCALFNQMELAYLHLSEPYGRHAGEVDMAFRKQLRKRYHGTVIVAGNYTPEKGNVIIQSGLADAVAFGRSYISNPDLPERIMAGGPYNEWDKEYFYGGGSEGYVDYPVL